MLESVILTKKKRPKAVNTIMLLQFDGSEGQTRFVDSANPDRTFQLRPGPIITETQKRFGRSSLYMPGSGHLSVPDAPELRLNAYWTIEYWVRPVSLGTATHFFSKAVIFDKNAFRGWETNLWMNTNTGYNSITTSSLQLNTWQHHAIVANGDKVRLYVNGQWRIDIPDTSFGPNASRFAIGCSSLEDLASNAYFQEFRVSKVPRYTGPFTPPSSPFVVD